MTRCARETLVRLASALFLLLASPHLHAAAVAGRVLDAAGAPVVGAKVVWEAFRTDEETLVDETRGASPVPLGETVTDAQGRFRVVVDKPGTEVSIRILSATLPSAFLEGPFDSADDIALEDVELPAVEKVSGRVIDEAGKGVAGAVVRARAGFGFEAADERDFYADATSGADGSFSMPNAPVSVMAVTARAAGFAPVTQSRFQRRGSEKVTLKSGGTIRGVVVDPAGQPAEGAVVLARDLAAKTDASGAFRLSGVLPGTHAVEALWKGDFAARKDTVRLKKGDTAEVSLRLARAAAVAGTVVDEKTRRPIAGVRVSASSGGFSFRGNEPARRARTDGKGKFRLAGLTPRTYSLRASKTDYLPVTMPGVVATLSAPGAVSIALQKAAVITGRVVDEKGAGVAGARVRFARDFGMRAMVREGPRGFFGQRREARTGPDGGFRLGGLGPTKSLTVEAVKAGYVPAARHGVTLRVGEVVKDVSLVLKQGLEAKGRVVDSAGQPVAGAEVRISRPETGAGRLMIQMAGGQRERPDAVTAADGSFRLAGLEPGEYALAVSREGYATKRVPSVAVEAGGPNEWPPVVLPSGVVIAGFVRNGKGEPVVGADVFVFGEASGSRSSTTDPEGRFRLEGFAAERPVRMSVVAEGYGALQRPVTPPVEELILVLKTSGAIRGRVEDAATNRPVPDFTASYGEARGGAFGGIRMVMGGGSNEKAFQSADGTFELPEVPAGKWTVTASAPGYRPAEVSGVEVAEGETKEGVVLSLKKGSVVSGRVLDPRRGTGVPNASVSWAEGSTAGTMGSAAMARLAGDSNAVTTDADGRFRFEGLPSGKLTLTAEHAEFLEASRSVEVDDQATVDLTLSLGGSIAGTVVGKDGRTPIPGAQVVLDGQGESGMGGDSSRADGSGNFLFEHLKPGRYRVSARSASGTSPSKDVVLAENQSLTGVLVEMTSGAVVRGTISGLPAGRLAGVRVFGSSRDYQDSAVTGDEGKFVLREVPSGILRLQASSAFPTSRSISKNVEVPEGAVEIPVEIVFEGTSRLSGRVTRGEKPIAGVYVSASPDPPSGSGRSYDQTDEDGRYAVEGLNDGNYQVSVYGQGSTYRKAFTVSGDTAGDIALPTLAISGIVTESGSNEPLEGASVQAESGRETGPYEIKRAVTDSRGFYSIEDVDAGSYQVTARKESYQLKTLPVSISGSPVELNLSLARGAGLAIRAVDGLTGLPLRWLIVLAYSSGGAIAFSGGIPLDAEGRGEIPSLTPGQYSVSLGSEGYARRSFTVQVPSGTLGVTLTPGGRVEIRTDVAVSARMVDATGALYIGLSRRDGIFSVGPPASVLDHIAPGSYRLIVTGPSEESSYPFAVSEGQTTVVQIR